MEFLIKIKETFFSVAPIAAIGILLGLCVVPFDDMFAPFLVGFGFVVIGLSVFLLGAEIALVPVGEKLGERISRRRSAALMVLLGFIVGFCVTFAEPDVNALCQQVSQLNSAVDHAVLRLLIAIGLGALLSVGLVCMAWRADMRRVFFVLYAIVFAVAFLVAPDMASIAFDASGSTTGPLAVPFVIALGIGISKSAKKGDADGFGLTGIASAGPILAVFLSRIAFGTDALTGSVAAASEAFGIASLAHALANQALSSAIGFAPLVLLVLILQVTLIRFPRVKMRNICLGMLYSLIGITLFLTGAEYGFIPAGRRIGMELFSNRPWPFAVLVSLVLGFFTAASEPAVWVLTGQVEEVTSGRISKRTVMLFCAFGVSFAVFLAALRVKFPIDYLLIASLGIGLALALSFFSPPLFTSLAFDSGGVASGPMSASFIFSFISGGATRSDSTFGVIGIIAIAPIISVQILGVIFKIKEKGALRRAGHPGTDGD